MTPRDDDLAFKERMFRVFGLFMSIFCDPSAPTAKFRKIVHPVINQWLPDGAWMLRDRCKVFKGHLPSEESTSCEKACEGPLIPSDILSLEQGCAVWMHCGEASPLEYLLFVRREGHRMEVRFGDAKHHSGSDKHTLVPERRDTIVKTRMVYAGLKRELGKHGLELDPFDETHVLLFTNIPNAAGVSPTTFRWTPWTPFVFLNDKDVDGNAQ